MGKAVVEFCRDGAHRLFAGEITGEELVRRLKGMRSAATMPAKTPPRQRPPQIDRKMAAAGERA